MQNWLRRKKKKKKNSKEYPGDWGERKANPQREQTWRERILPRRSVVEAHWMVEKSPSCPCQSWSTAGKLRPENCLQGVNGIFWKAAPEEGGSC